jgi:tetratricopeptide (TPR) repeat protein
LGDKIPFKFSVLLPIAVCFEIAAVFSIGNSWELFFQLHTVSGLMFLIGLKRSKGEWPNFSKALIGFLYYCMPISGPLLFTFIWLGVRFKLVGSKEKHITHTDDDEIPVETPIESHAFDLTTVDQFLTTAKQIFDIEPYIDILGSEDLELKRSVISKLLKREDKTAVTLLREAQKDEHFEIRFLSANAMSGMEKKLADEGTAMDELSQTQPSVDVFNRLGNIYFDHYYLGLVAVESQGVYLDKAIEAYGRSLKLDPEQDGVYLMIARVHIAMSRWQNALEILDRLIKKSPQSPNFRIWRAEVAFNQRDFKALHHELDQLKSIGGLSYQLEETVAGWLE